MSSLEQDWKETFRVPGNTGSTQARLHSLNSLHPSRMFVRLQQEVETGSVLASL